MHEFHNKSNYKSHVHFKNRITIEYPIRDFPDFNVSEQIWKQIFYQRITLKYDITVD